MEEDKKIYEDKDKIEGTNNEDDNFKGYRNEMEGGGEDDDALAKLVIKKSLPKSSKNIHIHPARIYISATIGLMLANVLSISLERNVYANETRLIVSVLIVCFLLHYMYSICASHIEYEIEVEEIEFEHKENIIKMKKHDIVEKFHEEELKKK